ncbi:hypothetical protein D4A35_17885 (plasmid) [Paraclostridium bifermentans]|uniref:Relaxase n=1 Tax=Paraclostridium bifermentans TaxID=1490 RepID=A0A5P3XKA8_PARBF|nr:MobP2 family relaxase [Paraclostridium bifermentans]QEZ70809.1 hypothetical protein D4A35_17885 [Paraclostridium bifermentans]
MSKTSPGIVLVSKYVSGKSSKFGKYIDYINREEAVRSKHFKVFNINKLDGYNNYMENPEKSKGIFTQNKSELTKSEREELKNIFSLAQKNNSIMWQDVISFNNEWLEKNGLYKSETGWINEGAIQDSVRRGMALVLKEECMEQSGVWSASMHFNTDNIHVHIALVEPHPTKPYKRFTDKKTGKEYTARVGNRKAKTLDKFKSKVANNLLERDKELAKISELIHKKIAPKTLKLKPSLDMQMLKVYNEIYKSLPNDMRLWKYNNNAMAQLRPQINSVIDMYLKNNHPEDFKELDKALIEEMKFREDIYGTGDKDYKRYEDYRTNKHQELYAKLGNAILREMKEIRKGHIQNNIYSKDLEILNDDNTSKENISNINNQINKDFKEPIDSDNTKTQVKQSNDLTIDNIGLEKNNDIIFEENNIIIDSENQSIHRKEFEKNSYPINETNNQINKDFKELIDSDNTKTQVKQSNALTMDNTELEKNNDIIFEENNITIDSENKSIYRKEFEKNSYPINETNKQTNKDFKALIDNEGSKVQEKKSNTLTMDNTELEKNNEIILEENNTNSDSENKSTNKKEFEKNSYTMHDNNYNSKDNFDRYNKTFYNQWDNTNIEKDKENYSNQNNFKKGLFINKASLNKIKKALDNDYQSMKNKQKYKQMENEYEYE